MSWIRPVATKAVKYGPHAQKLWQHAGKPATDAAVRAVSNQAAKRSAVAHAETVVDGTVVRATDPEHGPVWVVYAADDAVAVYPKVETPLTDLVAHVDLSKRRTPTEIRDAQRTRRLQKRARDVATRARRTSS